MATNDQTAPIGNLFRMPFFDPKIHYTNILTKQDEIRLPALHGRCVPNNKTGAGLATILKK